MKAQSRDKPGTINSGCTGDQDLLPLLKSCYNLAGCGQSPVELVSRQRASVVVVRSMNHGQAKELRGGNLPLQGSQNQGLET